MAPQVLWHIPQNRLETMDDILVHSRCCRRSMRRSRTRIIPTGPLSRSLCLCWPSSSLIPRPSPLSRRSLLLRWRLEYLYLPPARCHICTYTKQTTNKDISIYTSKAGALVYQQHKYKSQKQEHFTYLDGRMPPQEAAPCQGPPGSPLPHMGTGG
jgi:hypothetical protein